MVTGFPQKMRPSINGQSAGCVGSPGPFRPTSDRMLTMTSRFYFHLVRGETRINDRTGIEVCSDVLKLPATFDVVKERWPGIDETAEWQGWTVEIADPEGRVGRTVSLL
jgi:hypothetical protein